MLGPPGESLKIDPSDTVLKNKIENLKNERDGD